MATQGKRPLSPNAEPFNQFHSPQLPQNNKGSNLRPIRVFQPGGDLNDVFDAVPFTPSQGICTPGTPINSGLRRTISDNPYNPYVSSPRWNMYKEPTHPSSPTMVTNTSRLIAPEFPSFHPLSQTLYAPAGAIVFPTTNTDSVSYIVPAYDSAPVSYPSSPIPAYHNIGAIHAVDNTNNNIPWQIAAYVSNDTNNSNIEGSSVSSHTSSVASGGYGSTQQQRQSTAIGSDNGSNKSQSNAQQGSEFRASKKLQHTEEDWALINRVAGAMCTAVNGTVVPTDVPKDVIELASVIVSYGLHNEATALQGIALADWEPKSRMRLNSRQRRTLRRAHERALQALTENGGAQQQFVAMAPSLPTKVQPGAANNNKVPSSGLPPKHPNTKNMDAGVQQQQQQGYRRQAVGQKSRFAPS